MIKSSSDRTARGFRDQWTFPHSNTIFLMIPVFPFTKFTSVGPVLSYSYITVQQFPLSASSCLLFSSLLYQKSVYERMLVRKHNYNVHILDSLRRIQFWLYWCSVISSLRELHNWCFYHMVGRGFSFLQIDICILGCQLSCPYCFHLANVFKFVAVKILLQCLKHLTFFDKFPKKLCRISVMILCTICNFYTHTHTNTQIMLPFFGVGVKLSLKGHGWTFQILWIPTKNRLTYVW
jgi:hypothetical protein